MPRSANCIEAISGSCAHINDSTNTGRHNVIDQLVRVPRTMGVIVACRATKGIGALAISEQVLSRWHAAERRAHYCLTVASSRTRAHQLPVARNAFQGVLAAIGEPMWSSR